MSEEQISAHQGETPQMYQADPAVYDHYHQTIDQFLAVADVDRVYSKPVKQGEYTVIPTAEVVAGMGFGIGSGGAEGAEGKASGSGNGGGGGGRAFSRPVAVVVLGPQGVEIQPILDIGKVALTALTAFGFVFATLARMRRGPSSD